MHVMKGQGGLSYIAHIYINRSRCHGNGRLNRMILNLIESFHSLARDDKSHIRTWRAECA